jgi:hypothetical protein
MFLDLIGIFLLLIAGLVSLCLMIVIYSLIISVLVHHCLLLAGLFSSLWEAARLRLFHNRSYQKRNT